MRWALWRAVHWVCGWVPSPSPWRGPAHGLRLPEKRLDRLHRELPAALSRLTSYCALLPSEPSVWSEPPSPGLNDAPPEDDAHALYERAQQQLSIKKSWWIIPILDTTVILKCYWVHFIIAISILMISLTPWLWRREVGGRGCIPHSDSTWLRSFRSKSWMRMTGSISRRLAELAPAPRLEPRAQAPESPDQQGETVRTERTLLYTAIVSRLASKCGHQ